MGLKKANVGLSIRLPQPDNKKRTPLTPPRASPSNRALRGLSDSNNTNSNTPSVNADATSFIPSFANFAGSKVEEAQALNEIDELDGVDESPSNDTEHDEMESRTLAAKNKQFEIAERIDIISTHEAGEDTKEDELKGDLPTKSAFLVNFSIPLSTQVRKSAAAAIIRGPPAARHFGGNRGGLNSVHENFGPKCDGVGAIAICGTEKSIVFFSDRDPPGKTYPVGASGAVLSE